MEYKRYKKNITTIKSEDEDVQFHRFCNPENQRLIDYLEGRLETITAEDFGNITTLTSNIIGRYPEGIVFPSPGESINHIRTIELGNNITTIGTSTSDRSLNLGYNSLLNGITVIFPASLQKINGALGPTLGTTVEGATQPIIWDFSKLTSIPAWDMSGSTGTTALPGIVYVPKGQLNAWKTASTWSQSANSMQEKGE